MADSNFLTYKGKPLVRKGNIIYYGNMADPFVIMISVADSHKVHGVDIADKVTVQLLNTDPNVNPKDAIAKKAEKKGLWAAMDIGSVWLERALANA
ncbi:MAG: hypothetical protein PUK72_08735 [Oscillospiraceae bacterium]|nr:hypothetical protein [Oscillospiraceae bacterium]MDD7471153.1 hypothetical protein [Oscillospiraceae bacterium]MDY2678520.1 hypothetical protein [Oscillospiraceae bacterium]